MESILNSTKRVLGIEASYTAFDLDITTHINATFSTLDQIGVGPVGGYFIENSSDNWSDFAVPANQLNLVKSYIYLKVKSLFDPPVTSFHISAMEKQIEQYEWRLNMLREDEIPVPVPEVPDDEW
jgi:hypothetical protein